MYRLRPAPRAYGNIGKDYHTLGDYQQALEYHKQALNIAKEVGDRAREGRAYGNLGKDCALRKL